MGEGRGQGEETAGEGRGDGGVRARSWKRAEPSEGSSMSRQSKSSGLSFLFNSLLSLAPFAPIAVAFHYTLYVSYSDSAVSLPCNSSPFPLQFCHLSRSLCSRPQLSLLNSVPHTPPTLSLSSATLSLLPLVVAPSTNTYRLYVSCSDSLSPFPIQLSLPLPFLVNSLSFSLFYSTPSPSPSPSPFARHLFLSTSLKRPSTNSLPPSLSLSYSTLSPPFQFNSLSPSPFPSQVSLPFPIQLSLPFPIQLSLSLSLSHTPSLCSCLHLSLSLS